VQKKTKVWVMLGWSSRRVEVSFAQRPTVEVFDRAGTRVPPDRLEMHYHSRWHTLAYPVTAEVYVDEILNREQFRQHCDRHQTRSAILANLR